jgi:hypothetical protein
VSEKLSDGEGIATGFGQPSSKCRPDIFPNQSFNTSQFAGCAKTSFRFPQTGIGFGTAKDIIIRRFIPAQFNQSFSDIIVHWDIARSSVLCLYCRDDAAKEIDFYTRFDSLTVL